MYRIFELNKLHEYDYVFKRKLELQKLYPRQNNTTSFNFKHILDYETYTPAAERNLDCQYKYLKIKLLGFKGKNTYLCNDDLYGRTIEK